MRPREPGPGGCISTARQPATKISARKQTVCRDRLFPPRFACLTTPAELWQEFREHRKLTHELADALFSEGIRAQAVAYPWPVQAARVRFNRDGSFDRDPDGEWALTFMVTDHGQAIDIAACSAQFGTWLGRGFALGQEQIHAAHSYAFGGLRVHRTPLGWLKAERKGIVILQPKLAYAYLAHVAHLEAEDDDHAAELRRIVSPPRPEVRITAEHGEMRL